MNKLALAGMAFAISFWGFQAGFLPLWTVIMVCIGTAIVSASELSRTLRGGPLPIDTTFENTMTGWVTSLYERGQTKPLIRATWNCRNCGGPNINQVKCEYCGAVKE